jgi:hypothetical protein
LPLADAVEILNGDAVFGAFGVLEDRPGTPASSNSDARKMVLSVERPTQERIAPPAR